MRQLTLQEITAILRKSGYEGKQALFVEAGQPAMWKNSMADVRWQPIWKEIREAGEHYLHTPMESLSFSDFIEFHKSGERKTYQAKYFERRRRLSIFATLYIVDREKKWLTALENTMWAICDEFTWVLSSHIGINLPQYPYGILDLAAPPKDMVDLTVATTAFELAEMVHFIGEDLQPWVVHRVKKEIHRRVFEVFFQDPLPHGWELAEHNWAAVCAGSIGAAAIYLEDDSFRLAGMLSRLLPSLKNFLSGFDQDGATSEGAEYWQYGFSFFVYFSELLRERTGGEIDLLADEHVKKIALFPNACILSGTKVVNFSDSQQDVVFNPGLFNRLKNRFFEVILPDEVNNASISVDNLYYWPDFSRNLLWTLSAEPADSIEEPEKKIYFFAGYQWLISKHIGEKGMIAFAAKGGQNDENVEPHNHNDLGHFILHVNGETVLADLGSGLYTRQTFSPQRYDLFHNGSAGHSVPIVNGAFQKEGAGHYATVLHFLEKENGVEFGLDLTNAYGCDILQQFVREFAWEQRSQDDHRLIVRDRFSFKQPPQSLEEVFIAMVQPEWIEPGRVAIGGTVEMQYDPSCFQFESEYRQTNAFDGTTQHVWRILLKAAPIMNELVYEIKFICNRI